VTQSLTHGGNDAIRSSQTPLLGGCEGGALTLVAMLIGFAIVFPPENWPVVMFSGAAGTTPGIVIAYGGRRAALRRGLDIEPAAGQWPNRWALVRAAGWLIAFASVVGTLGDMISGQHIIRGHAHPQAGQQCAPTAPPSGSRP
jgi:hypothetical protein